MSKFVVRFLTRPDCHLCDDARPIVAEVVHNRGGEILELDIDQNEELHQLFGLRIPVVLASDGSVLAEGVVDKRELRKRLRRSE